MRQSLSLVAEDRLGQSPPRAGIRRFADFDIRCTAAFACYQGYSRNEPNDVECPVRAGPLNRLRLSSLVYVGLLGEGWFPVPLLPPFRLCEGSQ